MPAPTGDSPGWRSPTRVSSPARQKKRTNRAEGTRAGRILNQTAPSSQRSVKAVHRSRAPRMGADRRKASWNRGAADSKTRCSLPVQVRFGVRNQLTRHLCTPYVVPRQICTPQRWAKLPPQNKDRTNHWLGDIHPSTAEALRWSYAARP